MIPEAAVDNEGVNMTEAEFQEAIRAAKAEAWDEAIAAAARRQEDIEQAIYGGQSIPDEPLPNPYGRVDSSRADRRAHIYDLTRNDKGWDS